MEPELLLKYSLNHCTPAEKEAVEQSLMQSEELREHLHNLRMSIELSDDIREMESIDVQAAYRRTQQKIRNHRWALGAATYRRYAALLALPLLVATLVLGYLNFAPPKQAVTYAEVVTPYGTITRYEMPDQSVIWLNGGSKLRYPTTFGTANRSVELEGEAYFEVQANPEHPFYVNTTDGMSVYVYGTRFNVSAYANEPYIETVLEEGAVNILSPDRKTTLTLTPGEQLTYNRNEWTFTRSNIDVYEKTAWREGKLIFRNSPLDEVLKKLSRHFNTDIEFHNISGKDYKYRATFKSESLQQILDYLSKSANIRWNIEEQGQKADGTLTKKRVVVRLY